jgi:hypothetical protein
VENNSSSTFLKSLQLLKPVQNNDVIASSFKDQLIDFFNDPVRVIETLRCYSRLAMHEGLISTPQYNGWLATSMVRLPKCTKLTAYWKTNETLLLQKKFRFSPFVQKAKEFDFKVDLSACGPQSKYKNFTTNRDGWELVLFDPCYWTIIRPGISACPMCHGRITS